MREKPLGSVTKTLPVRGSAARTALTVTHCAIFGKGEMVVVRFSYVNFEHGGRASAGYSGDGGPYNSTGLVRLLHEGPWPDILGIDEGDRWDFNGGEGAYEAAAALRAAGAPPYVPYVGSLPREGGPFAPAILVDPNTIIVRRWYCHRLPDFSARNRNTLVFSTPGSSRWHRVVVIHGDIHDGDARLADAKQFDRFANPTIPCVILGDWNATLSGPQWEGDDWNYPTIHVPWRRAHKVLWRHGPAQVGPHVPDTRGLDYLCGYWKDGQRAGGIGWYDVAELAGDHTPTQYPNVSGRAPRTIDRALVNEPWRDAYVPGSYRVHPPLDPDHPDSDHKRISFAVHM